MIIDVHTHLNNYDESKIVPVEKCLEQLLVTVFNDGRIWLQRRKRKKQRQHEEHQCGSDRREGEEICNP